MENIDRLHLVLNHLKKLFVGKDDIIELLGICLVARENIFLFGPPGTAKSAIIRSLSNCVKEGNNFEYLLTRFTEPNEIFGPFDIRKLKEGELLTNTDGMMPEASMVFLDEIFNANSAILNSLLMALNEKVFRRGKETIKLPALMFVGASNVLPEDETLAALLDRFLIRVKCDYVPTDLLDKVLTAGWNLQNDSEEDVPSILPQAIYDLQKACKKIDLTPIRKTYLDLIIALRNTGVKLSDRRAVKIQNLIGASALICKREKAIISDLWVMKYIWDTEDQIEIITGIINNVLEKEEDLDAHPQSNSNRIPDAEKLIAEVKELNKQYQSGSLSYENQNLIKDKLRFIQNRSNWVKDPLHKTHIQSEIESLWKVMLETL